MINDAVCEKQETLKDTFNNMDEILAELSYQLNDIGNALYLGISITDKPLEEVKQDSTILETARRQRNFAEEQLKKVVLIREHLW